MRPLTPGDKRHGRYTTYVNHKCRCEDCRAAWAAYAADLKDRRAAVAAELARGSAGAA